MAVTDLTNTTWVINSTTCTAGYGQFRINGSYYRNGESYALDEQGLYIGYSIQPIFTPVATANHIMTWSSVLDVLAGDVVEFTGGTDATSSGSGFASLVSWLEANATQQTSGGSMYLGTSSISKMYIGNVEVSKVYLGQDLVYEKQAPTGYQVNVYNSAYGTNCAIYDGQDSSGTYLGTLIPSESDTYTITSGYIFTSALATFQDDSTLPSTTGNPFPISSDTGLMLISGSND